ncbi:hypothetical protein FKP32DRAFT_906829 [Trametes sanguinea]|nr:hypothetical protein FKP32DRAFT_906829 [Trametes sanguinea]
MEHILMASSEAPSPVCSHVYQQSRLRYQFMLGNATAGKVIQTLLIVEDFRRHQEKPPAIIGVIFVKSADLRDIPSAHLGNAPISPNLRDLANVDRKYSSICGFLTDLWGQKAWICLFCRHLLCRTDDGLHDGVISPYCIQSICRRYFRS